MRWVLSFPFPHGEVKHTEVKWLAQCHKGSSQWSPDLKIWAVWPQTHVATCPAMYGAFSCEERGVLEVRTRREGEVRARGQKEGWGK